MNIIFNVSQSNITFNSTVSTSKLNNNLLSNVNFILFPACSLLTFVPPISYLFIYLSCSSLIVLKHSEKIFFVDVVYGIQTKQKFHTFMHTRTKRILKFAQNIVIKKKKNRRINSFICVSESNTRHLLTKLDQFQSEYICITLVRMLCVYKINEWKLYILEFSDISKNTK